jgi:hypothetical protein
MVPDAAAGLQPGAGESIVFGEAAKAIPLIVHRVHAGHVGPPQFFLQLEVVGRIGEDHVNGFFRQCAEHLEAIPLNDLIEWKFGLAHAGYRERFV